MEKQKQSQRLLSLDALRGFDMFFIMGGGSLFVALATLVPTPFFESIAAQMSHAKWGAGFTFEDIIFPLFLFIAGISFLFHWKSSGSGECRKRLFIKRLSAGELHSLY